MNESANEDDFDESLLNRIDLNPRNSAQNQKPKELIIPQEDYDNKRYSTDASSIPYTFGTNPNLVMMRQNENDRTRGSMDISAGRNSSTSYNGQIISPKKIVNNFNTNFSNHFHSPIIPMNMKNCPTNFPPFMQGNNFLMPNNPNMFMRRGSYEASSKCSFNDIKNNRHASIMATSIPLNHIKTFSFDEKYLLDNLLVLLKDQNGCRIAQKKLDERSQDEEFIQNFINRIEGSITEVIMNQFGNYVVQKLFETVYHHSHYVDYIFNKIRPSVYEICTNQYGTRFFQKALELLIQINYDSPTVNEVLKDLVETKMMELIVDTNGNHVFQKILILCPKDKNQFLFQMLTNRAIEIAKLKQGGCTLQRAFDCSNKEQKVKLTSSN